MKEFKVIIPEENYALFDFYQENLPAVMVLNTSLLKFKPKEVFSWHLSLMIDFDELVENGMPAQVETDAIIPFEEHIDTLLKGNDKDKPNALFLGRITWNGTRELIYRVYDPEIANAVLQDIINNKTYPREFDYEMEHDENWERNKWHLEQMKQK